MTLVTRLAALERSRRADAERSAGALEDRMIAACGRDEDAMAAWIEQLCACDPDAAAHWADAYATIGLMLRDGDGWRVVLDDELWEPRRRRLSR